MDSICLIIPAAGRGSRLNLDIPKVFCPLRNKDETPFSLIKIATNDFKHDSCLILSPYGKTFFYDKINDGTHIEIQETPKGMGDAIFSAYDYWKNFDNLMVVWGDQCSINKQTVNKALEKFKSIKCKQRIVVPLVQKNNPYVDYLFNNNCLQNISQSRENEKCRSFGFSDVGVFLLSNFKLKYFWLEYIKSCNLGKKTNELNFLPFLVFLSSKCNFLFDYIIVEDITESRGLNNKEDLEFFRNKK